MSSHTKPIFSSCRLCSRNTRHEILFSHEVETDPSDYHEKDSWQVVRCLGCWNVGFRHLNDDYETVFESSDGTVSYNITENVYPRVVHNHRRLQGVYWIPGLIFKIYQQTLSAYGENAYVLASIGLRATIEAVCNHLELSGNTLEKRIDQLFKGGHVSNGDKKRLHAIRFLGNDAAHEIKEAKESELRVALEIVEHLLNSVFILEKKARSLETIIETYEEFERLLATCAKKADPTQSVSLSALLGRQRRLVGNNIDAFELKLKDEIANGKITYLSTAQEEKVGGKPVQLYAICDTSQLDDEETPS